MSLINTPPLSAPIIESSGRASSATGQWLMQAFRILFDVQNSGPTASRPTQNLYVGKPYFDTTAGVPIWWTGPLVTDWVDATGAPA